MIPNVNENFSSEFVNRWRNPGDEKVTNIPALSDKNMFLSASAIPYAISSTVWQLYNFSDVRVADASHLRLSSLSLNYKLQKNSAKPKSLFNNANVSLQGNDLFCHCREKLERQGSGNIANITRKIAILHVITERCSLS